jgi:hypothetical protein
MFWCHVEVLMIGIVLVVIIWAVVSQQILVGGGVPAAEPFVWLRDFLGWTGICLGGFSVLGRGEAAIFPLPYRWLGFARDATEQEARDYGWPWSARGK